VKIAVLVLGIYFCVC